jgi:hypothetical protein
VCSPDTGFSWICNASKPKLQPPFLLVISTRPPSSGATAYCAAAIQLLTVRCLRFAGICKEREFDRSLLLPRGGCTSSVRFPTSLTIPRISRSMWQRLLFETQLILSHRRQCDNTRSKVLYNFLDSRNSD